MDYAESSLKLKHATPGERLKYVRKTLLKLTRKAFAEQYGLSGETLKSWENGRIQLSTKGLERCMEVYRRAGVNLSNQWILKGEGLDPRISVDLQYYLREPRAAYESGALSDDLLLLQEIEFFKSSSQDAVVFLVAESDMLPFYAPGDYVGGRFKFSKRIDQAVGMDCIVELAGGERLLRRLVQHARGDGYNLVCLNPEWGKTAEPVLFDVDIVCVAPVIWHRRVDVR